MMYVGHKNRNRPFSGNNKIAPLPIDQSHDDSKNNLLEKDITNHHDG